LPKLLPDSGLQAFLNLYGRARTTLRDVCREDSVNHWQAYFFVGIAFLLQRFGTVEVFAFVALAMLVVVLSVGVLDARTQKDAGGDCAVERKSLWHRYPGLRS
jgi:hypothetical protein